MATTLACARAHRAAVARAGCAPLRRFRRARQRHTVEPGRARRCGREHSAMPEPARRFRVPGRVNLIGGQVDYHEGWVVSMAIDRDVTVTARPRTDGRVVARSGEIEGTVDARGRRDRRPAHRHARLGTRGRRRRCACSPTLGRPPVGADLEITSTVPIGGGLSSSAAFEVAVALALADVADFSLPPGDLALAAQRGRARGDRRAVRHPGSVGVGVRPRRPRARSSIAAHSRSSTFRCPTRCACWSCIPACRARSKAARTRTTAPTAKPSPTRLGLRVLRDATLDQVRDEPRGRHAVTEMVRVRGLRRRAACRRRRRRSARSCSRATSRRETTWRCRRRSSTRSSSASMDAGALGARAHRRRIRRLHRRVGAVGAGRRDRDGARRPPIERVPASSRHPGSSKPPTAPVLPIRRSRPEAETSHQRRGRGAQHHHRRLDRIPSRRPQSPPHELLGEVADGHDGPECTQDPSRRSLPLRNRRLVATAWVPSMTTGADKAVPIKTESRATWSGSPCNSGT